MKPCDCTCDTTPSGSKLKVYHWWPGREWRGPCPFPVYLVRIAKKNHRKYMTVAMIEHEGKTYMGVAECGKHDVPSRQRGRDIAIGRLAKELCE